MWTGGRPVIVQCKTFTEGSHKTVLVRKSEEIQTKYVEFICPISTI